MSQEPLRVSRDAVKVLEEGKRKTLWAVPWQIMGCHWIAATNLAEAQAIAERLNPEHLVASGDYEFETLEPEAVQ